MTKVLALACTVLFLASTALAQESESLSSPIDTQATTLSDSQTASEEPAVSASRPLPLIPLYVSFATLQMFDARSTVLALSRGAREMNPLIRSIDADPVAITAFKIGATATTIVLAEKLWRNHKRTAAVLTMVGVNSAYAFIVAHNYRTANRLATR